MPDFSAISDAMGQEIALGNTLHQWLIALAATVGVGLALHIARRLVTRHVRTLAARHPSDWLDAVSDLVHQTQPWFLAILSLYCGSRLLHLPDRSTTTSIVLTALLIQAALWGDALVGCFLMRQVKRRAETDAGGATTLAALGFVARSAIWTVIVLLILANLGVNVTAMVTGLGIGGVAVALAAQNILSDLFASASIVLDKPFLLGDFIIVGDDMGSVEHIGLKTTRVRSLSGEQLVFANSDLLKSRIRNMKKMNERRVQFSIGAAYETPVDKVAAIPNMLREAVESQPATRVDRSHFKQYGDSALIFEVVYYVLSADYNLYMDTQQAINLAIFRQFAQERIAFAYPTQTIYLQQVQQCAVDNNNSSAT